MAISTSPLFLLLVAALSSVEFLGVYGGQRSLFVFPLSHSLSEYSKDANFTVLHHLKASLLHSAARHRHRRHRPARRQQVSLPLSPGSDYTLTVSVGAASAPTTVSLYMDTGSDLVWFPCSPFECILCEGKPSYPPARPTPPPPSASRRIACGSPACSAVHSGLPGSDLCAIASCTLDDIETDSCSAPCPRFYYAYGDGSLLARLRRGPLALTGSAVPSTGAALRLQNFTFACAQSALAEPVGVAGFGRGPLSLPAQLAALSPSLAGRFSYCLVSHSFNQDRLLRPSPLILGRTKPKASEPDQKSAYAYTPLLHNPKHPYFYSVSLEAVSVGSTRIPTPPELAAVDRKGNGGMVVDSGTTFTMLPAETYASLANEFDRQMIRAGFKRAAEAEDNTGLRPCYHYSDRETGRRSVAGLTLHFAGNATVVLPRRNYFMGFDSGGHRVGCLMVTSAGEDYGGPAGTLGNFQQQGFEVVYDIEGKRVGFARRRCATLWEEMSRA